MAQILISVLGCLNKNRNNISADPIQFSIEARAMFSDFFMDTPGAVKDCYCIPRKFGSFAWIWAICNSSSFLKRFDIASTVLYGLFHILHSIHTHTKCAPLVVQDLRFSGTREIEVRSDLTVDEGGRERNGESGGFTWLVRLLMAGRVRKKERVL